MTTTTHTLEAGADWLLVAAGTVGMFRLQVLGSGPVYAACAGSAPASTARGLLLESRRGACRDDLPTGNIYVRPVESETTVVVTT